MNAQEFRLMMTIDGVEVPSSCIKTGTQAQCEAAAKRMARNKDKSPRVGFVVLPCIV